MISKRLRNVSCKLFFVSFQNIYKLVQKNVGCFDEGSEISLEFLSGKFLKKHLNVFQLHIIDKEHLFSTQNI